ncbi:MAG: NAD(P)H-binding protein [Pirellulales bacterium]|nr:NAD(P)H-binding protein [Pirellulales bacterium]
MPGRPLHVVTGALGYSGKCIARRLLELGHRVRTLTGSPGRPNPFSDALEIHPFHFDQPERLVESLAGADVLYNTYWVRFNHREFTHADAVRNTLVLFDAARRAGVRRVVHVSIANPSEDSPLEYYRGKARLERALVDSGLSYAILRPTVLFGKEDILVNNIAWNVRRFAVLPVFGGGQYRIQPVHVDDLARLAVEQGAASENVILDAVGPETFTYRQLLLTLAEILGKRRWIVPVPASVGYLGCVALGKLLGDVILTRDEVRGLMAGLLAVDSPPTGTVLLTDWARRRASTLGLRWASELARRRNRREAYDRL